MKKFCKNCYHIGGTTRYNRLEKKDVRIDDNLIVCRHEVSEKRARDNAAKMFGDTSLVMGSEARKVFVPCAMMRLPDWPCGREGKLFEPREEE